MFGSIVSEVVKNVATTVVSYNAYADCDLRYDDDGNPDEIVLKAGYNTTGMVSGFVDYRLDGKKKNPLQTFIDGSRKEIPAGAVISEGHNTDTGYGRGEEPRPTIVLTAKKDAMCFAYVDGAIAGGVKVGKRHQINWRAQTKRFTCEIKERSAADPEQWVIVENRDRCMPSIDPP